MHCIIISKAIGQWAVKRMSILIVNYYSDNNILISAINNERRIVIEYVFKIIINFIYPFRFTILKLKFTLQKIVVRIVVRFLILRSLTLENNLRLKTILLNHYRWTHKFVLIQTIVVKPSMGVLLSFWCLLM